MKEYGFNTTLLHGTEGNNPHGATQVPIYQSSAFRHDTAEELDGMHWTGRSVPVQCIPS